MVQRRNLVETDTEPGTLSYADPQTVYGRVSGTVTWLPPIGQVIRPGGTLYRVDGGPVILMNGSTPAYRDLDAADPNGADIEQLNRNLAGLGFDASGIVVDDEWQPATTAGVKLLQASLGETETGRLALGEIVFLPGDQLVSGLDAAVGSTGSAGGSSPPAADASTPRVTSTDFVSLTTIATTAQTRVHCCAPARSSDKASPTHSSALSNVKTTNRAPRHRGARSDRALAGLAALLKAQAAELRAATAALKAARGSPSRTRSTSPRSGHSGSASTSSSGGGSATPILQTTSTRLVVTVDLSASSQSEATLGGHVTVELPAGSRVSGKITAVSPVADSSNTSGSDTGTGGGSGVANGSSSTVPVTITLTGHHRGAGLDQAAVSVNFARGVARHVLSVPVTALIATPGGNYAVQEAIAPYRLLPVRTGLFAAGFVQISGTGIHAGLSVTDSQG